MQRYRVSFYYRNYRIGARHVRARSEGEARLLGKNNALAKVNGKHR